MTEIDQIDIIDNGNVYFDKNEYLKIIMDYLKRKYKIEFNFVENHGHYFFKYKDKKILENFNTSGECIDEKCDELRISIKGWKVLLSNFHNTEVKSESKYRNSENNGDFYEKHIKDWDTGNINSFEKDNDVHRGHYIAKIFKNYLINTNSLSASEKHKVNNFFGKGNELNISYQTRDANCNSSNFQGQLHFENRIIETLSNNKNNSVRYIIEDILFLEKSLGRILIIDFDDEDDVEFIFIPNTNKNVSNSPLFQKCFFDWNNS